MQLSDSKVTATWGDGEYTFFLPLGQIRELQDKCGAGFFEIYERVRAGKPYVDDLRETIRLGLIGGGLKPVDAIKLVQRYFDPPRPLGESVLLVQAILAAAAVGVPGDPVGKDMAEETATETPAMVSSSPPSTEPAQSLDLPPTSSTE